MRCLLCGQGIGPLRLLRDREFCSSDHRDQYREQFRQRVYEMLAPDPPPAPPADFIERRSGAPALGVGIRRISDLLPSPPRVPKLSFRLKLPGLGCGEGGWICELPPATATSTIVWPENQLVVPARTAPAPPGVAGTVSAAQGLQPRSAVAAAVPVLSPPLTLKSVPPFPHAKRAVPDPGFQVRIECGTSLTGADVLPVQPHLASLPNLHPAADAPFRVAQPEPEVVRFQADGVFRTWLPETLPPAAWEHPGAAGNTSPSATGERRSKDPDIIRPVPNAPHADLAGPLPAGSVDGSPLPALNAGNAVTPENFLRADRPPSALPGIKLTVTIDGELDARATAPPVVLPPEVPSLVANVARPAWEAGYLAPAAGHPAAPVGVKGLNAEVARVEYAPRTAGALPPAQTPEPARLEARISTPSPLTMEPFRGAVVQPKWEMACLSSDPERSAPQADVAATTRVEYAPKAAGALLPVQTPEPARPEARISAPLPLNVQGRTSEAQAAPDTFPTLAPAGVPERSAVFPPPAAPGNRDCAYAGWLPGAAVILNPAFTRYPLRVAFEDMLRQAQGLLIDGEDHSLRARLRLLPGGALRTLNRKRLYIAAVAATIFVVGVMVRITAPGVRAMAAANKQNLRRAIAERAAVSYTDDFQNGMRSWTTQDQSTMKSWSYSAAGYMHPGRLALYRPSVPLSNYRLEFLAQVENRSIDWVVRASDTQNYYALKFMVIQPGPRPLMAMVRYPVIQGSRGARVQTPLRMMIHANTAYRVTVDVKGNEYRTYVEGQEADFWTENRLPSGGVGFFSDAGDRARLYWVKLESNTDFIGRICALLSGKSGSGKTEMEKQAKDYKRSGSGAVAVGGPGNDENGGDEAQDARISRVLSKAASLHLEGRRDEAAHELRKVLDSGERHAALYFALAQLQYELEDYGSAAQNYRQCAIMQPLHPTANFNRGVCLGKLEQWQEAAEAFYKAIANDPARMETHLALGACLVHMGRDNEAIDAYDRFLARYPENDEALFGKAVALQKRERDPEAAELYERVLGRKPRSAEALANLVTLHLAGKNYEQVRKYAERLAEVQPRSQVALEGLAAAAFAGEDYGAAAEYSRRLAEAAPESFENWFNLGVARQKTGDMRQASQAYARAAQIRPDSAQAHLNLGVALHESGDLKGARSAYERALKIDPKLAGTHWNLGLVHEQAGDPEAAERFFAQVPKNSPDYPDAVFRTGYLRLQRADFTGGIEAFQACLHHRPDWPEARLNLGIAYWKSGDMDSARDCFQQLDASGVDSKEALRGLAALALERQEYDKAFEVYRRLIDSGERNPELLYNAALTCQKRGKAEDAATLYREALKIDPQFGEALLNLGHALMSMGNELEARSYWRKAVLAKPELAQHYFEPA